MPSSWGTLHLLRWEVTTRVVSYGFALAVELKEQRKQNR